MHLFRQPSESQVRRLLNGAKLPTADLTPEHLKHFIGCGLEEAPTGVVGLEIYGPDALLRSLAVEDKTRGHGCGKALVAEAERYAKEQGVRQIYLLTANAAKFFGNLRYSVIARGDAPDCIRRTSEFSSLSPLSSTFMAKDLTAIRR
jgi:amino-acid N-acetyltransferase